jgi:hypothetical protein
VREVAPPGRRAPKEPGLPGESCRVLRFKSTKAESFALMAAKCANFEVTRMAGCWSMGFGRLPREAARYQAHARRNGWGYGFLRGHRCQRRSNSDPLTPVEN